MLIMVSGPDQSNELSVLNVDDGNIPTDPLNIFGRVDYKLTVLSRGGGR